MKYLLTQDVLYLHHQIIEETGGFHGVRDLSLLAKGTARVRDVGQGMQTQSLKEDGCL